MVRLRLDLKVLASSCGDLRKILAPHEPILALAWGFYYWWLRFPTYDWQESTLPKRYLNLHRSKFYQECLSFSVSFRTIVLFFMSMSAETPK